MESLKVANYIKHLAHVYGDNELTPMKLQKLLYYSYAFYLVFTGDRLFESKIQKWKNGPVISEIWNKTNKENYLLDPIENTLTESLNDNQKTIIEDVFKVYGRYAAWTLSNMTHQELPWKQALMNQVISDESILSYYADKKEDFIFQVECLEDIEAIKAAKSNDADLGVDWEDLKISNA